MEHHKCSPTLQILITEDSSSDIATIYACKLANLIQHRIQLLYILSPAKFQHWLSIGKIMHQEGREQAEQILLKHAITVQEQTSNKPMIEIREGEFEEELFITFKENPDISHFIIANDSDKMGKSEIIKKISDLSAKIPVPIIILPKNLTIDNVNRLL